MAFIWFFHALRPESSAGWLIGCVVPPQQGAELVAGLVAAVIGGLFAFTIR
jgi:hypothetical protein